MKKSSYLLGVACAVGILASCSPEVKTCTGRISSLSDSLLVMQIGEYEVKFDVNRTQYTHGAVMPGDSVNVDYVGDLRSKEVKALTVFLVSEQGTVIDAGVDTTRELVTKPMSEEKARRLDEFVRNSKK